jgi:hypothetical protein
MSHIDFGGKISFLRSTVGWIERDFSLELIVATIACSIGRFFRNRDSGIGFYGSQDPGAATGTEKNSKFFT